MIWQGGNAAVFRETKARWGILSNFAPTPLCVNGVTYRTAEALYQVCRFPDHPDIQQKIIDAKSPMTAKMITKPYKMSHTRSNWTGPNGGDRIDVMFWTLQVKWLQSPDFRATLATAKGLDIIEHSARDDFWGAIPQHDGTYRGDNMLGRLLMELRDYPPSNSVEPPNLHNFMLLGKPVGEVHAVTDQLL